MRHRLKTYQTLAIVGCSLGMLFLGGCHWRQTEIASLHISADRSGSRKPPGFASSATVYVIALISNPRANARVKSQVFYEQVAGQAPNSEVPYSVKEVILQDGKNYATFPYSYTDVGWPKGTFRVEVSMLDENGDLVDRKSDTFKVF